MKVYYKGVLVQKINDTTIRRGNLLIQVNPEELTSQTVDLRCKFCVRPATTHGIDPTLGYPWKAVKVCNQCRKFWCMRECNEQAEVP